MKAVLEQRVSTTLAVGALRSDFLLGVKTKREFPSDINKDKNDHYCVRSCSYENDKLCCL